MTTPISITYGLGGYDPDAPDNNVVEEKRLDGTDVVKLDAKGVEIERRDATEAELAADNPAPDLETLVQELVARVDALSIKVDAPIDAPL